MKKQEVIVLGIVSPAGTRRKEFLDNFSDFLKEHYNYSLEIIKLNELMNSETTLSSTTDRIEKIREKINSANKLREKTDNKVFSYFALTQLYKTLKKNHDDRIIYCIDQLKRTEEIDILKEILGKNFVSLGIIASKKDRVRNLVGDNFKLKEAASDLIHIDENEGDYYESFENFEDVNHLTKTAKNHGQQMAKNILKSDVIVNDEFCEIEIKRVIELLLSHPFKTPTREEYYLNLSFSSSLKSLDLSRQVGAIIVDKSDNVISIGFNDVNKVGGGPYWGDNPDDANDYIKEKEANKDIIIKIKEDIANKLFKRFKIKNKKEKENIFKVLKSSQIEDITEFHRATHAEMNAILSAQRMSKSVEGATLYCTTYPCHNCAKHIISAGINKVIYLEPYDKSMALSLHDDAISHHEENGKVHFESFSGFTHNRFKDFFSYIKRKENNKNKAKEFKANEAKPRFTLNYSLLEETLKMLQRQITNKGKFSIEKYNKFFQKDDTKRDDTKSVLGKMPALKKTKSRTNKAKKIKKIKKSKSEAS